LGGGKDERLFLAKRKPTMNSTYWNLERVAGLFLALTIVATMPGFMMFWQRRGHKSGPPRSHAHWVVERSSILSGVILIAIGFMLLQSAFQDTDGAILAIIGATTFFFGGVLGVVAEALMLTLGYEKVYGLIVVYVIIAFLAEAAIGGAVIQSVLLAAGIGWATIVWNIAWLIVLSLFSRRDIYFPILHYVMPLVIGIALLLK
jgi:hypothetical protein